MADESDDLLDANEIEALLNAAENDAPAEGGAEGDGAGASASGGDVSAGSSAESLLDSAEQNLHAAVDPNLESPIPPGLGEPQPFALEAFDSGGEGAVDNGLGWNAIQEVELDLVIELGRTELLIEEVLKLKDGAVVPLDKLAGDPVDILVNGRLIARGEVLVLNDNFCVRVAEILVPEQQ